MRTLAAISLLLACSFARSAVQWSDPFEAYPLGQSIQGLNNWDWDTTSGSATIVGGGATGQALETRNTRADGGRFTGSLSVLGPFVPVQQFSFKVRIPTVSGSVPACNVYLDQYCDGSSRAFRVTIYKKTATTIGISHNGAPGWQAGPEMTADVWHTVRLSLDTAQSPAKYRVEVTDIAWDSGWQTSYGTYSQYSGITFLQENTDSVYQWDDWLGPETQPTESVLFGINKVSDYPGQVFLSTIQGLVNRKRARLVINNACGSDSFWIGKATAAGGFMAGKARVTIPNLAGLVDAFRPDIAGVVVWDKNVPATVNAATTSAGVLGAAVVMGDTMSGSPYDIAVNQKHLPILIDLRGRFTGSGTVWDTSVPSSGSAKVDCYLWAKAKYLDTGLCDSTVFGLTEDAYCYTKNTELIHTFDRDIITARKGFCVDLNPWPNEMADDEPGQPFGKEYSAYVSILQAAKTRNAGRVLDMFGYLPYKDKYANNHGGSSSGNAGTSAEGPGEWQNVRLLSQNGGTLWAEQNAPNMSFWRWAPQVGYMPQEPRPLPRTAENKTYICFLSGDYDGPDALYQFTVSPWTDAYRTSPARNVPVAWAFNPNLALLFPEQFRYFWGTKSPYDYFVGSASGAGYSFPSYLPHDALASYAQRAQSLYSLLDESVAMFNIDVNPPDGYTASAYTTFAGDGYGYINIPGSPLMPQETGQAEVTDYIAQPGNMPVYNLFNITGEGYGGRNLADSVALSASVIYGIVPRFGSTLGNKPNFLTLRTSGTTRFFQALRDYITADKPAHRYEVVDPWTFAYLRRLTLGGVNEKRFTVMSAPTALTVAAGKAHSVAVTLRNNGWEKWDSGYEVETTLYAPNGSQVDSSSAYLESDVVPGALFSPTISVNAPVTPGIYTLAIDLGNYGDPFAGYGGKPCIIRVRVVAAADAALALRQAAGLVASDASALARTDLDGDGVVTLSDAISLARL